ncbi:MAG: hypothetical protein ACJ79S_18685 [Gemmatimonadaceae bacterium]
MTDRTRRLVDTICWLGAGLVVAVAAPFWLLAGAALDRVRGAVSAR